MLGRIGRRSKATCLLTRPTTSQNFRRFTLPPSKAEDTAYIKQNPYTRELPSTLSQVAHVVRRIFKIGTIGVISIGSAAFILYQGSHIYVEKISLAPEDYASNPHTADLTQFEWDQELDNWTGSSAVGGTDPKLSWKARQAIRSAWMSFNWSSAAAITPRDESSPSFDVRLVSTIRYLEIALQHSPDIETRTRTTLLALQGNVAGAMGSKEALQFAETRYRAALDGIRDGSPYSAKIHSSLADVLTRLGRIDEAIQTYLESVRIIESEQPSSEMSKTRALCRPASARLLLRNLTALSALYSSSGDLKFAYSSQNSFLDLAQNIITEQPISSTPSGVLHDLYLQQRIATLKIHQAEVSYALNQKAQDAVELLSSVAGISERIALALSNKDESLLGQAGPAVVLAPADTFKSSNTLLLSVNSLLLDASRSAATAFRLLALLQDKHSKQGAQVSFGHLERALWWCGGVEGPAPNVPVAEWEMVWRDYKRMREDIYPALD